MHPMGPRFEFAQSNRHNKLDMQFTKTDLVSGFHALGSAAVEAGKIIDLAVYGGSCLMLVSNFRDASQDVDAVASSDQSFVDRVARTIARDRGWPLDWLNDGVRVYLSPHVEQPDGHHLFASYPSERVTGLRVYVPTPEYMLAMKLMSLRVDAIEGEKDKTDIEKLIAIVGITKKEELIALASAYYPEARASAKLLLAADRLLCASVRESTGDEAPRYANRRRERE